MKVLHGKNIAQNQQFANRSFLYGDAVSVYFFVEKGQLIFAEECYFFLMASMRKMRMNIPLHFTLEFFTKMFLEKIQEEKCDTGVIHFICYRNRDTEFSSKTSVAYYFELSSQPDFFLSKHSIELDLIKEITVNTNLLSNIRVHHPENTYAEIYAKENDLDDVILLNPQKRIARSIFGNLLFLENNIIKIPKQSEGAYISPLMESFVTYVHKNNLAEIQEAEIIAFESQKADEIVMISDEKGIFTVKKIRNKNFSSQQFQSMLESWKKSWS